MDNTAQILADRIVENAQRSLWVLDYQTACSQTDKMTFSPYMAKVIDQSLQELMGEALKIKEQIRTGCRVDFHGNAINEENE